MNCLTACQTLLWSSRSPDLSSIQHAWDMMGRRLYLPWNIEDLAIHQEQILQAILQETIRVLYQSMPCRVTAGIQARGGSAPY
ncbi:transposable element Tcb1 transposase [Trichonephila clavipes]|nr:transposable element Tcb1 transposase [Trichonephila clavipes]